MIKIPITKTHIDRAEIIKIMPMDISLSVKSNVAPKAVRRYLTQGVNGAWISNRSPDFPSFCRKLMREGRLSFPLRGLAEDRRRTTEVREVERPEGEKVRSLDGEAKE